MIQLLLAVAHEPTTPTGAPERRVALVPEAVVKVLKNHLGLEVVIETSAGQAAGYPDAAYTAAGARVLAGKEFAKTAADIQLRLSAGAGGFNLKPALKPGGVVVGLNPAVGPALALEKLPRTSRAQALDVLSSQANLAGYAAVLHAASHYPRLLPMLMTAAGSSKPAKVLVLGVGVAGLQAMATAKRLGAQVSAFDVRPEVAEQIISLGAKPIVLEGTEGTGAGGYARALTPDELAKLGELLAPHVAQADVVISTAQVPGRAAPVLITPAALAALRPGSVVLDMAAGGYNAAHNIDGGNCAASRVDEIVSTDNGVTLLAPTNLPAQVPGEASRFWAQNMVNLCKLLIVDGALSFEDELIAAMKVDIK
jgi:H+-translocating NAD(P) transhydrogenase subunit alpha